jgi:hypothetical protein
MCDASFAARAAESFPSNRSASQRSGGWKEEPSDRGMSAHFRLELREATRPRRADAADLHLQPLRDLRVRRRGIVVVEGPQQIRALAADAADGVGDLAALVELRKRRVGQTVVDDFILTASSVAGTTPSLTTVESISATENRAA